MKKKMLFPILMLVGLLMVLFTITAYAQCEGDCNFEEPPEAEIIVDCRTVSYLSESALMADYSVFTGEGMGWWSGFVPLWPPVFEWEMTFDDPVSYADFWVIPPTGDAISWWEEEMVDWPGSGSVGTVLYVDEYIECGPVENWIPLYRMVTLIDKDAPDWYWGQGHRNGTCWIKMKHDDGYIPNVDIQALECGHLDHPDFVYQADGGIYIDAWVSYNPVTGEYHYPDPLWDSDWVDKDYTTD